MKKIPTFIFLVSVLMITVFNISVNGMDLRSVDEILAEIRLDQNISNTDTIEISKVTLVQLEELGDSVMEEVIGDSTIHERLDEALGGEGSKSLTNTHLRVGYNYLAGIPITMMTFIGAGGMMSYGSMMDKYGFISKNDNYFGKFGMMGNYNWIWMIIVLLSIISLLVLGIYGITRLSRKKTFHPKEFLSEDSALLLLKERYARGEITQEEYNRIYDDLK